MSIDVWKEQNAKIAALESELTELRAFKQACEGQEAVASQFQDYKGEWHGFIDQRHYENTIADGSWPIRKLYEYPDPEAAQLRMRIQELERENEQLALDYISAFGQVQERSERDQMVAAACAAVAANGVGTGAYNGCCPNSDWEDGQDAIAASIRSGEWKKHMKGVE
jgi:hypothetical protein